jgi:hypothetical protein
MGTGLDEARAGLDPAGITTQDRSWHRAWTPSLGGRRLAN